LGEGATIGPAKQEGSFETSTRNKDQGTNQVRLLFTQSRKQSFTPISTSHRPIEVFNV